MTPRPEGETCSVCKRTQAEKPPADLEADARFRAMDAEVMRKRRGV
jgi:hypothetical protein